MHKSVMTGIAGVAALMLGSAVAAPAQADPLADFYKGKTISVYFGFGFGGTYGKYAQMLAKFMRPHVPGKPNIIVQSMPGAGGIKVSNYAYNVMVKNGTALLMPPETMVISQMLRPKKVKFKSNEFTWLGTAIQSNATIVVRSDAGIRSIADLKGKQVIMAASGKGSPTFLMPTIVNALLGTKLKVVTGYKGSKNMMLAMERGEATGISLTWLAWKSGRPDWFEGDKQFATTLVQIGYEKEKELPNVPMLSDLVTSKEDKAIVGFMSSLSPIGRGFAFPPGVSKDKIAALRAAFWKTVNDPTFVAAAVKRRLRVNPLTGAQVQKIVDEIMKTVSPATVKKARKLIFG